MADPYEPDKSIITSKKSCGDQTDSTSTSDVSTSTNPSTVISSGQFRLQIPLLSIDAFGLAGWRFGIEYLRHNDIDGMLGANFNFSQNTHLEESGDNVELVTDENFRELFEADPYDPTKYSSVNNNTMAVLTRSEYGEDEFTLTSSKGNVTKFHGFDLEEADATPGRIKSIRDRYGNTQTFSWTHVGGVDQLQSVTDGYGRTITYRYYGTAENCRLREIEDFLGRKLNFQYDDEGRLVAVVTPSIAQAAEGNTFPGGTAYVFQYDSDNPRPERRDDLIRVWYPNEATPYINAETRQVDVARVYAEAMPRYIVEYGQDPTDVDHYGRVIRETAGDPNEGPGGSFTLVYITEEGQLPENLIDEYDPIVLETVVTDRNGNQTFYDFNGNDMPVRVEVLANRAKLSVAGLATSYATWTKYNDHNQPLLVIYPEGNSVEYEYDDGEVYGLEGVYVKRAGLLIRETQRPDNDLGINGPYFRPGSSGQTELTRRYFYDPIFNRRCAVIERRGNPIDRDAYENPIYFEPQNEGDPPSDYDRRRYATITYFDYQKDTAYTVTNDEDLQELLGFDDADEIQALIDHVDADMKAEGLSDGFGMGLGDTDTNGDGTGAGEEHDATHLGNVIKIQHPSVRQLVESDYGDPWEWDDQERVELFTRNHLGQVTTHTCPEGNVTVNVRYPYNDPEGDGQFVSETLSAKQYGRIREVHKDADPDDVMSLVGEDGDLIDFKTNVYPRNDRTNTPGQYLDLVTRYQGVTDAEGCCGAAYNVSGNVLSETDARGFTTTYDRNEMGQVYRTTSPAPYYYRKETYYDANGNVIREDVEDKVAAFTAEDPTDADYAKFLPSGSSYTAHVPTKAGDGGAIRPGWFTNLYAYDLLDNRVAEDLDATGSTVTRPATTYRYDADQNRVVEDTSATGTTTSRLVTTYEYDPNGNLIKITKSEGNTVEYDYDERDLRIATRTGYVPADPDTGQEEVAGAVTVSVYDGNGNLLDEIGASDRPSEHYPYVPAGPTSLTATIEDAFRSGDPLPHTGDWLLENTYDGFDRVIQATDVLGGVTPYSHDPDGRVTQVTQEGTARGPSPTDRDGGENVPLAETATRYDEAGRAYEVERAVFLNTDKSGGDPTHNLPSTRGVTHTGGGLAANSETDDHDDTVTLTADEYNQSYVLTRNVYDRAGRLLLVAQDNTAKTHYEYDGVGNPIEVTDAIGNVVETTYDAGGNVVHTTRTEKATISNAPTGLVDEVFESYACYDALNRLVVSASQGADGSLSQDVAEGCTWPITTQTLLTRFGYDSRGNQTLVIDPKGNTSVTVYDGAGRAIEPVRHLRQDGDGGPPDANTTFEADGGAAVRTRSILDGNGRLTELIDDRGGTTIYTYDTLDRRTLMTFHDGSERTTEYNAAGDIIHYFDENWTEFDNTYDAMGRMTKVAVTIPEGSDVEATDNQEFQYDGLSRLTKACDTGDVPADPPDSSIYYDSLGRIVEEDQLPAGEENFSVTYHAFTSLVPTGFTYPDDRDLVYDYDVLYRRTLIQEDYDAIAEWSFFGPGRVAELGLGNGLVCTYMNNDRTRAAVQSGLDTPEWGDRSSDRLGYDGAGRAVTKRYLDAALNEDNGYGDTEAVVGFTTAYDHASNKEYERHLHAEARSHLYPGTDSLDRLRAYERGTLQQAASGAVSVGTDITLPETDSDRSYDLDGLGNWRRTAYTAVGEEETTEVRRHNLLNQVTRFDGTDVAYDHGINGGDEDPDVQRRGNGNIADDGTRKYLYDAFNRLVTVQKEGDPNWVDIATYRYDPIGRRVRKDVWNGGLSGYIPDEGAFYLYAGVQCIEERDVSPEPPVFRQYVWGLYVDELIQQREMGSPDVDYYLLSDLLYRSVALTDENADIVEAYDTDAYGNTLIFDDPGAYDQWFTDDDVTTKNPICQFLFTGRRYDPETETYYYRARYYNPQMGRFLSRDPAGYQWGMSLYEYAGSQSLTHLDPLGLQLGRVRDWATAISHGITPSEMLKRNAQRLLKLVALNLAAQAVPDAAPKWLKCQIGLRLLSQFREIESDAAADANVCDDIADFLEGVSQGIAPSAPSPDWWGVIQFLILDLAPAELRAVADGIRKDIIPRAQEGQRMACEKFIVPYCPCEVAERVCGKSMEQGRGP